MGGKAHLHLALPPPPGLHLPPHRPIDLLRQGGLRGEDLVEGHPGEGAFLKEKVHHLVLEDDVGEGPHSRSQKLLQAPFRSLQPPPFPMGHHVGEEAREGPPVEGEEGEVQVGVGVHRGREEGKALVDHLSFGEAGPQLLQAPLAHHEPALHRQGPPEHGGAEAGVDHLGGPELSP